MQSSQNIVEISSWKYDTFINKWSFLNMDKDIRNETSSKDEKDKTYGPGMWVCMEMREGVRKRSVVKMHFVYLLKSMYTYMYKHANDGFTKADNFKFALQFFLFFWNNDFLKYLYLFWQFLDQHPHHKNMAGRQTIISHF